MDNTDDLLDSEDRKMVRGHQKLLELREKERTHTINLSSDIFLEVIFVFNIVDLYMIDPKIELEVMSVEVVSKSDTILGEFIDVVGEAMDDSEYLTSFAEDILLENDELKKERVEYQNSLLQSQKRLCSSIAKKKNIPFELIKTFLFDECDFENLAV